MKRETIPENPQLPFYEGDPKAMDPRAPETGFVGFRSPKVPAYAVACLEVRSQVTFKGRRVVVSPKCAEYFWIHDIRIGQCSQFLGSEAVSCLAFPPLQKEEQAVQTSFRFDTASVGQSILMLVKNESNKAQDFDGLIWGEWVL